MRARHLAQEQCCAACCTTDNLDVHHAKPYHLWPELELEPANLVTLCQRCHLFVGHLGDWKAHNPMVFSDAAWWRAKVKCRLYARN